MISPCGVIPVLKPPGMTSNDVVSFIKRKLGTKKAGHCGTLDPGAAGVLCVCVGRATKLSSYLMDSDKKYIARFEFGKGTDTLDSYGKVCELSACMFDESALKKAALRFTGEITQIPPAYSAVKINGKPLYSYARKGGIEGLDIKTRKAQIYSIDIKDMSDHSFLCEIACSKGTYVRTLLYDIAQSMNLTGCTSFLLRSSASGFDLPDCFTLDEIACLADREKYDFLIPMTDVLPSVRKVTLDDYLFPIITTGSRLDLSRIRNADNFSEGEPSAVYCRGEFIGIGRAEGGIFTLDTMIYLKEQGN